MFCRIIRLLMVFCLSSFKDRKRRNLNLLVGQLCTMGVVVVLFYLFFFFVGMFAIVSTKSHNFRNRIFSFLTVFSILFETKILKVFFLQGI